MQVDMWVKCQLLKGALTIQLSPILYVVYGTYVVCKSCMVYMLEGCKCVGMYMCMYNCTCNYVHVVMCLCTFVVCVCTC